MRLLGIALFSLTLLFPNITSRQTTDIKPVTAIQEYVSVQTEGISLWMDAPQNEKAGEEDPASDPGTDVSDNTGIDIRYLLFLQDFRHSINDAWTPFMEFVSEFATRYLILAVLFIYWVINKRNGLYTIASMCLTLAINQLVKLTACVYRPWIRDPRIIPAGNSIVTATGYSFPSGHTATAAPLLGGMAVTSSRKYKWFSVLCVLLILLVAFSRNYLGVHTPQDVFVAVCESAVCLFIMQKIFAYVERDPEKEDLFLIGGVLFGFAAIAYVTFKPYPLTYVEGKLLVDPQKMMNDGYGDIAFLIAFCIGRFIERRWIRFRPTGISTKGIIVCAVGMVIFVLMNNNIGRPLDQMLGSHWGHFARRAITVFYYIALYPLVIKLVMKQTASEAESEPDHKAE